MQYAIAVVLYYKNNFRSAIFIYEIIYVFKLYFNKKIW